MAPFSRGDGGTRSHSHRLCRLKLLTSGDVIEMPLEVTTKVGHVRQMLAEKLGNAAAEELIFITKSASSYKVLLDLEEIPSNITVKGVPSWTRQKAAYRFPHCIVGAGHCGLRQGLSFLKEGIHDFLVIDRLQQLGGTAWVRNANPTSKLQTELGVYHLQYGIDLPLPQGMKTWPSRAELLQHFQEVCEDHGLIPHLRLGTEADRQVIEVQPQELDIRAREFSGGRWAYDLTLCKQEQSTQMRCASIQCYPGGLTENLRLELPGEEEFEGCIGYGMFDEFDYGLVREKQVVIFGMGAFAVENVRTCLEHGAATATIICRRKNLAIPRVVDWFINQSDSPPTAAMVLNAMQPMYALGGLDDPWSFYAVIGPADRSTAVIRQKSRFGIGDFYFLASCYGKCRTLVGSIKRLAARQVVLDSAERVPADHLLKVLGFTADPKIEKLFGLKELVGYFGNGDWRQWIYCEFPGIDAGRFGGTSLSPAIQSATDSVSWILQYPEDIEPVLESNLLPRQKAKSKLLAGRPCYVFEPRAGGQILGVIIGFIPGLAEKAAAWGALKRQRMHQLHPLEGYLEECAQEWYTYCQMFKDCGDDRPFPRYPYTSAALRELVDRNEEMAKPLPTKALAADPGDALELTSDG
ncbi:unnamed protein product [Effrenium voratum]|nr:unnamed protein product [Effrenium voratum]